MRGILVVIFTFLIIGLLYRWRSKQEKAKVVKLKEFIAQQENWASPKFNNGGFVVGIFIFLLGLFSLFLYFRTPDSGMPLSGVLKYKNKENRPSKNIKIPTTNPPLLNLGEAQFSCWAINSFNLTTFAFSCLDLQRYKSPIIRKVKITTSIPRINL